MDGINLVEQTFAANAVKTSNSVSNSKNDVLFSDYMAKPVLYEKESVKSADTKDSRTEYQQYKYKKKDIEPSDKTPEKIKLDEISEDIEKLEEDLIETVSEDLHVDKEQLLAVMEYLGLAPIDLIDQENLAKLAIELNVSTDSTELLFNETFQQLLSDVNEIVSQTVSNLGMPYEEIAELISQMDVLKSTNESVDIATIMKDFTDTEIQNQNVNASTGNQETVITNEDAEVYSGFVSDNESKAVTNNSERVNDEPVLNLEKVSVDNAETASDTYSNGDRENNAYGNLDNGASVMAHSQEVNSIFNLDEDGINDIQKSFVSSETT